jgi:hypothetical protein
MSEQERFYLPQLETLDGMRFPRDLTLPLLIKFDGSVERVVTELFGGRRRRWTAGIPERPLNSVGASLPKFFQAS